MTMKKKLLALSLTLMMAMSLLSFPVSAAEGGYEFWDLRNTENITTTTYDTAVDGNAITVTKYTGYYAASPTPGSTDQRINIFVPSNATKNSAILHKVNNSGWQSNSFPTGNINGGSTSGANPSNDILALARGMIIVTYGARSRGQGSEAGAAGFYGHSPATMTDTKAALRFLRYNMQPGKLLEGVGNPDWAFVTGTSGGGALSVILAASGDSPDYFASLYEIGAAGIEKVGGDYVSTISDAYFGTIAYCPISDLPMADQAYEFTYNVSRTMRAANANVNGNGAAPFANNFVMQASNWLAGDFAAYINGLGLKDEDGMALTAVYTPAAGGDIYGRDFAGTAAGTFKAAMQGLLERGINKAIDEYATGKATGFSNADSVSNLDTRSAYLQINGAEPEAGGPAYGSKATICDFDQFLTSVPSSALKIAPAFDNMGLVHAGSQNENNLVGTEAQQYSHWHEWAWNDAGTAIAGVGRANTGLSWDEFLQTADGALVALQSKMTTPIPYLVGASKIPYLKYTQGSDACSIAPYWYVRHGQADRDTSFAIGTMLNYALLNNSQVKNDFLNFNFAWAKAHSGNYDNPEAYAWLDSVIADASTVVSLNGDSAIIDGETAYYTVSVSNVSQLATATLWIEVSGDYLVGDTFAGLNGFQIIGGQNWENVGGNLWRLRVTLANFNGGVSSDKPLNILSLSFNTKEKLGASDVKLVNAKLSGYDAAGEAVYFDSILANNIINLDIGKYFAPLDLNRDGVIDQLDLTVAQLYYMAMDGDGNWPEAKTADINHDGVVDIEDLILVLAGIVW